MFRLALVVALTTLFTACGPTNGACQKNGDCAGTDLCLNGTCSTPGVSGGGTGMNGGGSGNTGGGTGTGGGSNTTGGGGSCCLNGSFYACGNKAAFDQCAGFDAGACHAACGVSDFTCHMNCDTSALNSSHDPSACTRTASRDGECNSGGTGDICSNAAGVACSFSSQCSSNNCTDGYCRGNGAGARCSFSSQCDSNNCTDGCCRGTSKGSQCSFSSQCTSNNCSNGRCQ